MEAIDVTTIPPGVDAGAFFEVQRAAGARFYESSSGALWTQGFGDPEAEYRSVRRATGLWDVPSENGSTFVIDVTLSEGHQ